MWQAIGPAMPRDPKMNSLSSPKSSESVFLDYTIKVSKMNGWRLVLELANELEYFDRLSDAIEEARLDGDYEGMRRAEEIRNKQETKIEILRKRQDKVHR